MPPKSTPVIQVYVPFMEKVRQTFERRAIARRIRKLALDRLREQYRWHNRIHAFDSETGITITMVRCVGGDILDLEIPVKYGSRRFAISSSFAETTPIGVLRWILAELQETSPTMELSEFDHSTRTKGNPISGPPVR